MGFAQNCSLRTDCELFLEELRRKCHVDYKFGRHSVVQVLVSERWLLLGLYLQETLFLGHRRCKRYNDSWENDSWEKDAAPNFTMYRMTIILSAMTNRSS